MIPGKSGLALLTPFFRKEVNWIPLLQATGCVEVNKTYLTWIHIHWWYNQINVLLELFQTTTQPTYFVPGVGITDQVIFNDWTLLRCIFWRPSPLTLMLMMIQKCYLHPLRTRVQAVPGIVSQHLLWQILIELRKVHGFSPTIPTLDSLRHTPSKFHKQLQHPNHWHVI